MNEDTLCLKLTERIPSELRRIVAEKIPPGRSPDYYQGLHDFCLAASEILCLDTDKVAKTELLGAFLLELKSKIEHGV